MRFPGSLSARIIAGFAVLIVTFGGISLTAVLTTTNLNSTIRVIQLGYIPLSIESRNLSEKQQGLLSYLRDELTGEPTARKVEMKVRRLRDLRDKYVSNLEKALDEVSDIPPVHARDFARTSQEISDIRHLVAGTGPLYAQVLAAPPLGASATRPSGGLPTEALGSVAADSPLGKLQRMESRIARKTQTLEGRQRADVQDTARSLEFGSRKMRLLTIMWGAIALVVGLLITIWATVNLRPLRRLGDAAREIARGDYGQRIDERGPREVADLAREFNTMGSAIQERERELVRTERLAAVGKMAAMITHEVRNPLSSIGLNTELLEEELAELSDANGATTGEARALCQSIQSEVDRLTAITEEYLYFARLPKPKLQEEALGPMVKSLIDFEREPMSTRGVTLEVDLAAELPPVMVDEGQLRQALLNLLRNAGEAVGEVGSGRVRVYTRRGEQPGTAEVVVQDDGPGIVEELAAKIFDPFFSTKEGGTGLGLALTHQIVRDHGGSIRVESRPGHGAAFIVALPVAGGAPV
ncbi:MAG TPA: ATP-binding protein [Kofleriaceae bacterium]|nr:ATP-binding protein [Kofleriaceae bacterium]